MLSGLQLQILFITSREVACKSKETKQEENVIKDSAGERHHQNWLPDPDQASKHGLTSPPTCFLLCLMSLQVKMPDLNPSPQGSLTRLLYLHQLHFTILICKMGISPTQPGSF